MCKNEFCCAMRKCGAYAGEYNCNLITWIINLSLIIYPAMPSRGACMFGTKLMMIHQFCGIISIIRISYLITFAKQLFVCLAYNYYKVLR